MCDGAERRGWSGSQYRDLLAVQNRFERGAHRDFGLSISDVAAQERSMGRRDSMSFLTSSMALI